MSYLVMECHPSYAILLDEEGRFHVAANLRYEVGQAVREPELMRDVVEKRRPARGFGRALMAAAACLMLAVVGFGYYANFAAPYTHIYMTINPSVQMDLNRQGTVVGTTGLNEDGRVLLQGYDGRGKDEITVANEIIDRAIQMGFLAAGERVVISIDSPDDALITHYGNELSEGVAKHMDGQFGIELKVVDYRWKGGGKSPGVAGGGLDAAIDYDDAETPRDNRVAGGEQSENTSDYDSSPANTQAGRQAESSGYSPPQADSGYIPPDADGSYEPPEANSNYGSPDASSNYGSPNDDGDD